MPQLDVTTYSTQIFWLLLCFCTMFLIAKMFILPRMDNVFNNRLRHINSLLDQASELSKEAKKIDKETSDFVENAKIDIAMQEEKAIRSFNENIEKMQEDLNKKNKIFCINYIIIHKHICFINVLSNNFSSCWVINSII